MKNLVKTDSEFREILKRDYVRAINMRDMYGREKDNDMVFFWEGYLIGIEKYLYAMGFMVEFISDNKIEIVERNK